MIKVNFIRHGETIFNRLKKIQGLSNINLSSTGIEQAKNIKLNETYDIAFHSSLNRSKDTLDIICNNLEIIPKKILDDSVIERCYGIFEGLTKEEIFEKYPELYKKWSDNENILIDGAESIDNVILRIKKFIKMLIDNKYKNVLVVTHSGVLFALYKFIVQINLGKRPKNIKFENCSSNILEIKYNQEIIDLKFYIGNQAEVNRSCPAKEIISDSRINILTDII